MIHDLFSIPFHAALSALAASMEAVRRRLAWAWAQAAARRELSYLDDAALRDIGLTRNEIGSVVAEVFGEVEQTRLRVIAGRPAGI